MICHPDSKAWADAYEAGYNDAALGAAARAIMQHNKDGRGWIPGSLWDTLARECGQRILELRRNKS